MNYSVVPTKKFRRQYRKLTKLNSKLLKELQKVIDLLAEGAALPAKNNIHKLSGKYNNYWECHIAPDWLLVYSYHHDELILELIAIGSHSELF